jgi:prepilin-type processing-associated H-X9-DG protein
MRKYAPTLAVFLTLLALIFRFGQLAWEVLGRLTFGWISFAGRVIPKVAVSWDGVVTSIVCLVLFTLGLHAFLRWFYREVQRSAARSAETIRRWSPRWTASLVAITLLMFVIGISAGAIMHQAGWLMTSPRPLLTARPLLRDRNSPHNLLEIGMASLWGGDTLPEVKLDSHGRMLTSWQTAILPYLETSFYGSFDPDKPWDDPVNSAYFRGIVPEYLNPAIETVRSPQGYALSHYAGNVNLFARAKPLALKEVERGLAGTILAGEVSAEFKPWGDPTNLRDPVLGINAMPGGFGSPSQSEANFLFLDGSVRSVRNTTDPDVLRKMSTPSFATDLPGKGPG